MTWSSQITRKALHWNNSSSTIIKIRIKKMPRIGPIINPSLILCKLFFFSFFTGTGHEEHFRLGLPDNCSFSAWCVRYILALSTRIQQSTERWRCSSHECQQTVWFTGRWNCTVYPRDAANNLKRFLVTPRSLSVLRVTDPLTGNLCTVSLVYLSLWCHWHVIAVPKQDVVDTFSPFVPGNTSKIPYIRLQKNPFNAVPTSWLQNYTVTLYLLFLREIYKFGIPVRFRITFTANSQTLIVPRDQVFP